MEHIRTDTAIDLTDTTKYSSHTYVSITNTGSNPILITYNMNLNQFLGEQGTYIDGHFSHTASQNNHNPDLAGIYDLQDLEDVDYQYRLKPGVTRAFMKVNFSPVVWNHDGGIDIAHLPIEQGGDGIPRHVDDRDDGLYDDKDYDLTLDGDGAEDV